GFPRGPATFPAGSPRYTGSRGPVVFSRALELFQQRVNETRGVALGALTGVVRQANTDHRVILGVEDNEVISAVVGLLDLDGEHGGFLEVAGAGRRRRRGGGLDRAVAGFVGLAAVEADGIDDAGSGLHGRLQLAGVESGLAAADVLAVMPAKEALALARGTA